MPKLKKIPTFKTEDEEREFWATHDTTDYIDWSMAERAVFPNLKPSTQTISIRIPTSILDEVKLEANRRDIPYQSFLKQIVADHLEEMRLRRNLASRKMVRN